MKKTAPLLTPMLAAALVASCASHEWGHATVRTKSDALPPAALVTPAPPAPQASLHNTRQAATPKPKPAKVAPATRVAPAAVLAPAAQPSPIAAPACAPKKLAPAPRPALPQNNPARHRKSYPTMPGQNRGLQSIYNQRG